MDKIFYLECCLKYRKLEIFSQEKYGAMEVLILKI